MKVALLFCVAVLATGCAHVAGYAGEHPGSIKCSGKVSLSGTGSISGVGIVGASSSNSWSLIGDCGERFEFTQEPNAAANP